MDENFENFLKSRDIEEDTIEYLRTEKIDCKVIDVMSDEDLAKIFPVYGDRIAISNYCKNAVSSCSSRKQSLLDRLRKKINQKRKKKNVLSSSDEENEAFPKKLNMDKKMSVAMKKQHNRFIEIGWLHSEDSGNNFKQVRTRSGGGTRKVNVAQSFKKEDLLKIAIELFFPNGISSKGKISDFKTDVFDFGGNQLNDHYNVEEMYTVTGLTRLRIYLSTQRIIGQVNENIHAIEPRTYPKQKCETLTSGAYEYESYCANIAIGNPYEERLTNERVIDENECYNVEEFLVLPTPSENTASDFLLALELQQVEDANNSILPIEKNSVSDGSIAKLTLHRGHIFEELIDIYTSLDISTQIDIQIVLPNGNEEAAVDFGGVFRDALSEFWTTMYEKCTQGTTVRIPVLRHDFGDKKWTAIAKIFLKSWLTEKYFPIKLSTVFIENSLFKKTITPIEDEFMKYVSEEEKEVFTQALHNFGTVDFEQLLDLLDQYGSRWKPSEENFSQLLKEIAHKELVQKPTFVVNCFHSVISNKITQEQLAEIYNKSKPTSKNILPILKFEDVTSIEKEKVMGYLKKYIRDSDENYRTSFLRFCTGADMIVGHEIKVSFSNVSGLKRLPVGHTCSYTLELPFDYQDYTEFRSEFNSVLSSNIWIMDLI
nr:PREDICTED: uncharacterized protein LOC103314333 [Tribolium castaneum]XP_015840128.1 PREDICTED: uncharacterized protein LOC103314333 [Tribolium castaneum]|eukprot:XP_008198336.1 PREDICTED: uncharacterized protein LOC103314333 [Tribolium castaneum]